jgi:rRNA maturation protein Nop10
MRHAEMSIFLWSACLLYTMRRVTCRRCGTVIVEEVPWATANAH